MDSVRREFVSRSAVSLLLCAACLLILHPVARGQVGKVYGSISADNEGVDVAPPGGLPRPNAGGTFDIHAGAKVKGAVGGDTIVFHNPSQIPFFRTFMPMKFSGGVATYFTPPADKDAKVKVNAQALAVYNNPDPLVYKTAAKDFTGATFLTQTARKQATDPKNGLKSSAEALARVEFQTAADGTLSVSAKGSYVDTEREKLRLGPAQFDYGPDSRAATLVRDPVFFTGVHPGDVLQGTIGFSSADFRVQNTDDYGIYSSLTEMGTDLLGLSPGPLGLSSDGNPLFFRMQMTFLPGGVEEFAFGVNNSMMAGDSLQFLDPQNGNQVIAGDVGDFLISRLAGAIQYDSLSSTWSLPDDLKLFSYRLLAPTDVSSNVQLDYLSGQIASAESVPEPSILSLLCAGVLGSVLSLRRVRSKSRSLGA